MRKFFAVGVIASALLVACGNGDDASYDAASPLPQATSSPTKASNISAGGDCQDNTKAEGQADLEMQDFQFAPPCLIMSTSQGLRLHNEGEAPHNFSVEDVAGIDVDVQPGKVNNTETTGLVPGTYTFFCKFHKDSQDMFGELRIKAA